MYTVLQVFGKYYKLQISFVMSSFFIRERILDNRTADLNIITVGVENQVEQESLITSI